MIMRYKEELPRFALNPAVAYLPRNDTKIMKILFSFSLFNHLKTLLVIRGTRNYNIIDSSSHLGKVQ